MTSSPSTNICDVRTMSWWTRSGTRPSAASTRVGSGMHLEQVGAVDEQHVEVAALGGLDHLRRREAGVVRARRSPTARSTAPAWSASIGVAAGERGRVGAHLGAALHARVAADRHQPGAVASDVAAGEADVDDRLHALDAVGVLGDPHAPDEHRRPRARRTARRSARTWRRRRRRRASSVARSSAGEVGRQLVPALGVGGDPVVVDRIALDEALQHGVGEGDVALRPDRHVEVAQLGAEQRRLGVRRHPVALQARLQVRVDDDDPGAPLAGQVQVLREHRLVVGDVACPRAR